MSQPFDDVICPVKVESNPYPISNDDFESYLNHDFDLIHSTDLWKSYRVNKQTNDNCYTFIDSKNYDPVWWIKIVGEVDGDINNVDDLLDKSLKKRQPEWHVLFRGGYSVWKEPNNLYEICYYRYASTMFGVSPRDTCYMKLRRNLYCDVNGAIISDNRSVNNNCNSISGDDCSQSDDDQPNKSPSCYFYGFILSYRSIDLPDLAPVARNYVRTKFSGAHLITLKDFKNPSMGFVYTYLQHAHPGGWIPVSLANAPQCDIIMNEIIGVRKAMKNAFSKTYAYRANN